MLTLGFFEVNILLYALEIPFVFCYHYKKRFQEAVKMIKILYEDKYIIGCEKPTGILSAPAPGGDKHIGEILCEEAGIKNPGIIHRLDRGVSGVMILAKRPDAAGKFSALISERAVTKEYLAIVHGVPGEEKGIYKDLLFRDSLSNKTFVTDKMRKGVRDASLEYRVLASSESEDGTLSLVRIKLHTGRTHQIRVQFASRQTPLFGDGKYGSHTNRGSIALYSARLAFAHPFTKKQVDIKSLPEVSTYPWSLFETELSGGIFEGSIL